MVLFGKKKKNSRSVPDLPMLDRFLTTLTFLLLVVVLRILLSDTEALLQFLAGIVLTILAIFLCKRILVAVGPYLGTKTALKQPRNLRKFADQGWQLAIHLSMTICEWKVLASVGWQWWTDQQTLWVDGAGMWHADDTHLTIAELDARRIYLVQLAIWFVTAFSHKFIEARHKDYFVMYLHHVVTIALLTLSWKFSCIRVGIIVLLIHDSSDIVADILKMVNYLGLDENSGLYLSEAAFLLNLVTWAYSRLWLFPMVVVRSTLPSDWGGALNHVLPLERGWATAPALSTNCCRVMLCMLVLMHAFWYYLFLRILYKLTMCSNAHDAGREEYEGSSDSEPEDEVETAVTRRFACMPCDHVRAGQSSHGGSRVLEEGLIGSRDN